MKCFIYQFQSLVLAFQFFILKHPNLSLVVLLGVTTQSISIIKTQLCCHF